jgi:hypothetical protein
MMAMHELVYVYVYVYNKASVDHTFAEERPAL